MTNFLHYDLISEFKKQFYKNLLTMEHVKGSQVMLKKLVYPDGGENEQANFWGYVLEKDGIKYLLSSKDSNDKEIRLSDILPIMAKDLEKVANKTDVYFWIRKPVSAKFKSEKTMTFKEMVDTFSSLKHSNPKHQKLMWFITLAQMIDRANFRISTPAGFGKDSTVDILGNLIGGASTIENPTIAKLEFMTNQKLLAVNEVVDVPLGDWRNIQQFLLAAGAHKPEITKHSRAVASGVGEYLDISKFSLSLMYNDIDHYNVKTKFFDEVTKGAVKDRFPALRLYGNFEEDFNSIKYVNIKEFVQQNIEQYKKLIYAYTYYKENYVKYFHKYDASLLKSDIPFRWKTNLGRLLKMIDVYCDSQQEFNEWVKVINKSLDDYEDMLLYPALLDKLSQKVSATEFSSIVNGLSSHKTFTDRNKSIINMLEGSTNYIDRSLSEII